MDRECKVCGHTTHDGKGACHFCGTDFPPQTKAEVKADAKAAADVATAVELPDDELEMPTPGKKKH